MASMTAPRASGALSVPLAFVAANAASYALLLVAAHRMSSRDYGVLSSLLGLLLISTIPMLALQTVSARRAATAAAPRGIARGTVQVAALATAVLAGLSPALARFLHLPDVYGVLLVAATVPATAVLGAAQGLAQGRRRFRRLAGLILAATGGRSLGGLAGLLVGHSPDATLVGVLVGSSAAALGSCAAGLRGPGLARRLFGGDRSGMVHETLHAAHAHGTFLLLTSLDVLLARHVLSSSGAGTYAVGSVVTRATVWLPQSVVLLLFASLADRSAHTVAARRAAAAVCGLGAATVAVCAALGPLAVTVVGGGKYHELDGVMWLFALLGALLAVVQLAVLAGLAQRNPRRAALLWGTIGTDLVAVLVTGNAQTPTRLVATLCAVTAAAAVAAAWLLWRQPVIDAGQAAGVNPASSPAPNWDVTPEGTG
jgi:O-antigen/teichoic acid export membrane protein